MSYPFSSLSLLPLTPPRSPPGSPRSPPGSPAWGEPASPCSSSGSLSSSSTAFSACSSLGPPAPVPRTVQAEPPKMARGGRHVTPEEPRQRFGGGGPFGEGEHEGSLFGEGLDFRSPAPAAPPAPTDSSASEKVATPKHTPVPYSFPLSAASLSSLYQAVLSANLRSLRAELLLHHHAARTAPPDDGARAECRRLTGLLATASWVSASERREAAASVQERDAAEDARGAAEAHAAQLAGQVRKLAGDKAKLAAELAGSEQEGARLGGRLGDREGELRSLRGLAEEQAEEIGMYVESPLGWPGGARGRGNRC